MQDKFLKSTTLVGAALAMGLLAGCNGTSTYGTGVSQEAQLLEDLTSIASIGGKKNKTRIDYMSRPKLVKPPEVASLPSPAEKVESESGYFPVNPEEKRQITVARIAEAERNGEAVPLDILEARRASAERGKRLPKTLNHAEDKYDGRLTNEESQSARAAFLKRQAEIKGANGSAPRRYLTEPPRVYRTPNESAPVGVLGEKEHSPYAKKKTTIFGSLFGGNKKKSTTAEPAKPAAKPAG